MVTDSQDHAKNLSILALFIATDVRNAMQACFTTFVADAFFLHYPPEERKTRFATNPANTLVYRGLQALTERSIVTIFETLKDEHGLHPHNTEIRRKRDLQAHRHTLSHPMTVDWDYSWMQRFRDAGRASSDWVPAQVWDLQRSINESLRQHNLPTHNDSLMVTRDMAVSLHAILELSRQPERSVPTVDELLALMVNRLPTYQAALEKHPDGMRDTNREQARMAERKAQTKGWWDQRTTTPEAKAASPTPCPDHAPSSPMRGPAPRRKKRRG